MMAFKGLLLDIELFRSVKSARGIDYVCQIITLNKNMDIKQCKHVSKYSKLIAAELWVQKKQLAQDNKQTKD